MTKILFIRRNVILKKFLFLLFAITLLVSNIPMDFLNAAENPKAKAAVEPGMKQYIPGQTEDDLIADEDLEEIPLEEFQSLPTVYEDGTLSSKDKAQAMVVRGLTMALKLLSKPTVTQKTVKVGGKTKTKRFVQKHTPKKIRSVYVRNGHLAGKSHPVTGVKFDRQGFPKFKFKSEMTLPLSQLKSSNATQFKTANVQLKKDVFKDITKMKQFNKKQLDQIEKGVTPTGYTWHHHQHVGKMQLVNTWEHAKTGHTGGRSIWGSMK